jgi:hypothetical protein
MIFTEKQIAEMERKFKYLSIRLVDSCGYYQIAGKDETVLLTTFLDKFGKLCDFVEREHYAYGEIITHGEFTYTVFNKLSGKENEDEQVD